MTDLLYHLLDEFLFSFSAEFVVCRRVEIIELDIVNLRGESSRKFDLERHPQGTEIKAITMHQMKVLTTTEVTTETGALPRVECSPEGDTIIASSPYECYVLVDI
ncbi:Archease [Symbiodinium pilosum]|uniref:Archease protein n=1 Tax=Symbiodinium pilosum TaxID=2952 RepID=A0A812VKW9_SYMPI|nr:Archease [Symbiodinium pilosum]